MVFNLYPHISNIPAIVRIVLIFWLQILDALKMFTFLPIPCIFQKVYFLTKKKSFYNLPMKDLFPSPRLPNIRESVFMLDLINNDFLFIILFCLKFY